MRADYERVLKQRAALLKSAGAARRAGRRRDLAHPGRLGRRTWPRTARSCCAARLAAVAALRPHAVAAYAQVAPASAALAPALRDRAARRAVAGARRSGPCPGPSRRAAQRRCSAELAGRGRPNWSAG